MIAEVEILARLDQQRHLIHPAHVNTHMVRRIGGAHPPSEKFLPVAEHHELAVTSLTRRGVNPDCRHQPLVFLRSVE